MRAFALAVLAWCTVTGADAQTPSFGPGFPSLPRPGAISEEFPITLEGAVDEDEYIVGPGDTFVLSIGGTPAREIAAIVSADGRLVVPEAGSFVVAGGTLAQARARINAALDRAYRNVTTDVVLSRPRQFTVHVSGAVLEPGRVPVRAAARVEDALTTAQPESVGGRPAPPAIDLQRYEAEISTDREARPAYRNIRVLHRDGTEDRVDLARYLATGDVDFNPYLLDGDAVHLPTFDPTREGVFVGGAVARRGVYDVRPDDTALTLLSVASGDNLEGVVRAVRVVRAGGGVEEVPLAEAGRLRVSARDQVFAIEAAPEAGTAAAVGSLAYPGTYPIQAGETTLSGLVEMAGGLAPEALLRGAYLERRERSEPLETRADIGGDPLDLENAPAVRRFENVSLPQGQLSDLNFVGRRLFVQETFRTPRVSVDIEAALSGGADVTLRDGDRLVVPADLGQIRVYGQVNRAGYVPYQDGLDAAAYVERAGGLAPSATEVYVVDPATGLFALGGPVLPGDAVYAAREPTADTPQLEQLSLQFRQFALQQERDQTQLQLQEDRDRRQARTQLIQTVLSTIGTAATLVFAYVSLQSLSN